MPIDPSVRVAQVQARADTHAEELSTLREGIGDFKEVLVEFMRTAVSNPATGFVLAVVTVDVLYRSKIIDDATFKGLTFALYAAFSVDLVVDVAGLFTFSSGGNGNADLIRPVTQTMVQAPSGNAAQAGLMAKLIGLVRGGGAGAGEVAIPAGAAL